MPPPTTPRTVGTALKAAKSWISPGHVLRIKRRRATFSRIYERLPFIKYALFAVGIAWMLALPLPDLNNKTYIDENALQPSQVNTYWNWADVHRADRYLSDIERLRDESANSQERAQYFATEFQKLGLAAGTQEYNITTSAGNAGGTNAYAMLASPRASGAEAMVVSASWLSLLDQEDGTINVRGVATVLSLAAFFSQYSLWAKDLVFVIGDDYLEGTHAFLSAYHGEKQTNMYAEPLTLASGVIWTALNIDYPGHSFSHLGVYFEGLNGRLPNQDLVNSFLVIASQTGGVPIITYDLLPEGLPPLPSFIEDIARQNGEVRDYLQRAETVLRHIGYEARGRGSGVHGLFHRYRVDAITLFAVPAEGPHGFYTIGRVIESTMRTTNNLLERLHASFFFYIMTGPLTFLKIGAFLPSAVLVSVGVIFAGLYEWVNAGWVPPKIGNAPGDWKRRPRPTLEAIIVMLITHIYGALLFAGLNTTFFFQNQQIASIIICAATAFAFLPARGILAARVSSDQSLSLVLKGFNMCIASTVISATSVLNFSLAATLALGLGIPISFARPSNKSIFLKAPAYLAYVALATGWLVYAPQETVQAFWAWNAYGVWFALFICVLYVPLMLQAGIVCLLSP